MNRVQPIRDKAVIEQMKADLMRQSYRNYMMFNTGINTGLRISDMLPLKVKDTKSAYISVKEDKTEKTKKFFINELLRMEFDKYTSGMKDDDYLFPSRKGGKPISRVQAYRILDDIGNKYGIEDMACHSLRKTFGYWHYKQYKDVALLQYLFNHSAPSITMIYIGITQEDMDKSIESFYL